MLHLYPVRAVLTAIVALSAFALLATMYSGLVGRLGFIHDVRLVASLSSSVAATLYVVSHLAWRWLPIVRRAIFPYLGGRWVGELRFEGLDGQEMRIISLNIEHTPYRLSMVLDSAESTSQTLTVHAERVPGADGGRLYYVFVNRRKEGLPGAGDTYRGLAVMRIEQGSGTLHGDYFTERRRTGTLFLSMVQRHPWWMPWK